VPFLVQFWFFASPVVYPAMLLGEPWRTLFGLNPMTGVVEGFRSALLGTAVPGLGLTILASAGVALLLVAAGLFYFRRVEDSFADVI
jgi:lipopolysaccharide transport system permease protein